MFYKPMPATYSYAKDVFRAIGCLTVMAIGIYGALKFLPDMEMTANLLTVWIIGFAGVSTLFVVRPLAVYIFRLK
jgi:hypothetical protein